MREYKYECSECKKMFTRNYIITKPRNGKKEHKKYCSKECRQKSRMLDRKFKKCSNCDKMVRYYPNSQHKNLEHKFCDRLCMGEWYSNHAEELNLKGRASKMRESWNEESWKKSIETRKQNGNIIDWDQSEWKQYWRRCNDLTRKIRKEMLKNWDGYDYIDGEYIKDNLSLHFAHGDYPTLDHIKPRSQAFKEGLSPYEITIPENLKWTKRRNNSAKYNKKL